MTVSDRAASVTRRRVFYGWYVVAAGFWLDFLGYGIGTVALGVFFPVMSDALGWGRGLLSGALLVNAAVVAATSPWLGRLVDRRGPRLPVAAGALGLGLGAATLGLVGAPWQFYAAYGVLLAVGQVGLGDIVNHTTVIQWFVRMRGRALGMVTMGFSAAGILLPLPLTVVIERAGWRAAWLWLGVLALAVGLAAAAVMRRRPEDLGLHPDGADHPIAVTAATAVPDDRAVRAAVRSATFWLLLLGATAGGLALFGINLHLVSFLVDRGIDFTVAAGVVTALYTFQLVAKPLWGFIAERLPVRVCLGLCYAGGGAGVLLLLLARDVVSVVPFMVVYGLTRGAQSLLVSLSWAEYFGRGIQGRVRGLAAPFRIVSAAGGPILGGVLYDRTGSYTAAFLIFAAMFLLGGLLGFLARPPRPSDAAG
jgi:MFS family permease